MTTFGPRFPYAETVTLIRRTVTGRDSDGNDMYTDTESPFAGTVFSPAGSTELVQGQQQVSEHDHFTWVEVVPDLTAVDAIRRPNGYVYEIDGSTAPSPSPLTGLTVLRVNVNRVTG